MLVLDCADFSQADRILQAIAVEARKAGLEINADKTKVLVVGDLASAEHTRTLSLVCRLNASNTLCTWDP